MKRKSMTHHICVVCGYGSLVKSNFKFDHHHNAYCVKNKHAEKVIKAIIHRMSDDEAKDVFNELVKSLEYKDKNIFKNKKVYYDEQENKLVSVIVTDDELYEFKNENHS